MASTPAFGRLAQAGELELRVISKHCMYKFESYIYHHKLEVRVRIPYLAPGLFMSLAHVCKPEIAFKIKNWGYLMIVDPLLLRITVDRN